MTTLEVEEDKSDTDHFIVSEVTAEELGVDEDDLLLGRNPINQKTVVGKTKVDSGSEENKIAMSRTLLESIGLDTGFEIEVEAYDDELKEITKVEFAVKKEGDSEEDPLAAVKEDEKEFLSFVKDRVFTKYSECLWLEKDLLISLRETDPDLEGNEVADLSKVEDFSYTWGDSGLKSFDGVLLIDTSGSMEIADLEMENIRWVLERISKGVEGERSKEFLEELKGKENIKRYEGAAFCVLMYLVQKIGRGVGDKISVITFSTDASPVQFQDNKYFSAATGTTDEAAETIIEGITYARRGHTNLSEAFREAIEAMKDFKIDKMKMIVMLTDGKPNPPFIDDSQSVMKIVEENLAPRKDVVVNTIGLGEEVDHHLMDQIARKTGGEYNYVTSLQGLSEAYSRYATSISVTGRSFVDGSR